MNSRPFFRHNIDELTSLVAQSQEDLAKLNSINHELTHRNRPKARELKKEVEKLISTLAIKSRQSTSQPEKQNSPQAVIPDRLVVECPHCKTANFVTPLEEVVQHLSCSNCHVAYDAVYKHGILRTQFKALQQITQGNSAAKWIAIVVTTLIALVLILNK